MGVVGAIFTRQQPTIIRSLNIYQHYSLGFLVITIGAQNLILNIITACTVVAVVRRALEALELMLRHAYLEDHGT